MPPPSSREEIILPFPATLAAAPVATHCRATLILASTQTLKARGHYDRYRAAITPRHLDTIVSSAAAMWLPIEVGVAHYHACDALNLSIDEQLSMGGDVVHSLQKTFLGSLLRAATAGAGISPITGLQKFTTIYTRSMQGGGASIVRLGPKDVRAEFVGIPFAEVRYFRVAYRGFIQAGCELFARRVVVAELSKYLSPTTLAYRIAWV